MKANIVSPENIMDGVAYTFNITPSDKAQFWGKTNRCEDNFRIYNDYLHSKLSSTIRYELYQELSRNGRIHYHGIIIFDELSAVHDFYANRIYWLQENAIIEIDTCEDEEVWEKYCMKYQHLRECCIDSDIKIKKVNGSTIEYERMKSVPTYDQLGNATLMPGYDTDECELD